jgi:hypothetical protein
LLTTNSFFIIQNNLKVKFIDEYDEYGFYGFALS